MRICAPDSVGGTTGGDANRVCRPDNLSATWSSLMPATLRRFSVLSVVFLLIFPALAFGQPIFIPLTGNYDAMSRNGQHVITQTSAGELYHWSPSTGQVSMGLNIGTNGYIAA